MVFPTVFFWDRASNCLKEDNNKGCRDRVARNYCGAYQCWRIGVRRLSCCGRRARGTKPLVGDQWRTLIANGLGSKESRIK